MRRTDGVRLADDVRAAILVAGYRKRETEGKKQPDDAEERSLQDSKRLLEAPRKMPDATAQKTPRPVALRMTPKTGGPARSS
jgi:hypothetical protein